LFDHSNSFHSAVLTMQPLTTAVFSLTLLQYMHKFCKHKPLTVFMCKGVLLIHIWSSSRLICTAGRVLSYNITF
jgi:hypothetical protein